MSKTDDQKAPTLGERIAAETDERKASAMVEAFKPLADAGLYGLGVGRCGCGRLYSLEMNDCGLCCNCERDKFFEEAFGANWRSTPRAELAAISIATK